MKQRGRFRTRCMWLGIAWICVVSGDAAGRPRETAKPAAPASPPAQTQTTVKSPPTADPFDIAGKNWEAVKQKTNAILQARSLAHVTRLNLAINTLHAFHRANPGEGRARENVEKLYQAKANFARQTALEDRPPLKPLPHRR